MKKKTHRFTVTVKTHMSREGAFVALLSAHAKRQPDGAEFHITRHAPRRTRTVVRYIRGGLYAP